MVSDAPILSEEWRQIECHQDYLVSDQGRVKSLNYNRTGEERVLVGKHYAKSRYTFVTIGGKTKLIHVLVAEAFIGPRPIGLQVNHIDGNRRNNALSNLEYVTPSENKLHAYRLGLCKSQRGAANSAAKLNDNIVREIKASLRSGASPRAVAPQFNISRSLASLIRDGKRWAHVD